MSTAKTATAETYARVLVVDDEPGVVSFVARALHARGFDVDVAERGDEALAMAAARRYDVVAGTSPWRPPRGAPPGRHGVGRAE